MLKDLADVHFPKADRIVLGQNKLSTHMPASPYATFQAPEARRLAARFEWHHTPRHGSWLNMADCPCWPASAWLAGSRTGPR